MARSKKQSLDPQQVAPHDRLETPCSDDRAALTQRLMDLYNRVQTDAAEERRKKLLTWSQWAP